MNMSQTITPGFAFGIARLAQYWAANFERSSVAARAQRQRAAALDDLRGRIAQYESQPGFASDLRAALLEAERDLAPGAARRR
jgi:hypothetical protein